MTERDLYFGLPRATRTFQRKPDLPVLRKQHALDEDLPPTSSKMDSLWPYKSQAEVNFPKLGLRSKMKKHPEQGLPIPVLFSDGMTWETRLGCHGKVFLMRTAIRGLLLGPGMGVIYFPFVSW